MAESVTTCRFGNTTQSQGFDFTFGPGVTPSVCNLYTIPHVASLPQVANLTIQTRGQSPLVFPQCCLQEPRLSASKSGQKWVLPILDRRWKWQAEWGPIYGHYNIPKPDGFYTREKTPQELATLLLTAMGETGFDISRLPNTPRPEVHWDGAHAASELDQLCASLGCVVVRNPLTNAVEIWKIGQGSLLPAGNTTGKSYTPILPIKPEKIIVEAGPTLFQACFHLQAVGLDTDEKWKPINSLSYMPAGGGGLANVLPGLPELTVTYPKESRTLPPRRLAEMTVMRCYRVDGIGVAGSWIVNGLFDPNLAPTSRKHLKLFTHQADEEISPADSGLRPIPARVYGKWYTIENTFAESLIEAFQRGEQLQDYTNGYSFDTDTGIVSFNEPLVLFQNGQVIPAELRIETGFHAGKDGIYDRVKKEYPLSPGWTSPPRVIQRPDIFNRVISRYAADGTFTVENGQAGIQTKLDLWGNSAIAEYVLQEGGTVNYDTLRLISPDGLTQQVTWSGGGGRPPATVVSQAQRHNRFVEPPHVYRDRLTARRLEQAEKAVIGRADGIAKWGAGVV